MAVRGGGGQLYEKYLLLTYLRHREIGREHKENTGKTQGI